jgi:hypothetical protein
MREGGGQSARAGAFTLKVRRIRLVVWSGRVGAGYMSATSIGLIERYSTRRAVGIMDSTIHNWGRGREREARGWPDTYLRYVSGCGDRQDRLCEAASARACFAKTFAVALCAKADRSGVRRCAMADKTKATQVRRWAVRIEASLPDSAVVMFLVLRWAGKAR